MKPQRVYRKWRAHLGLHQGRQIGKRGAIGKVFGGGIGRRARTDEDDLALATPQSRRKRPGERRNAGDRRAQPDGVRKAYEKARRRYSMKNEISFEKVLTDRNTQKLQVRYSSLVLCAVSNSDGLTASKYAKLVTIFWQMDFLSPSTAKSSKSQREKGADQH
ncbi:hypothetical protein [Roseovarius gaetbuli]|uniref:hypothetical protein n=1 Tax=Roseovarius gaetbuli TaxID=1356575 RepID=UPI00111C3CAA|nr:hypothetical protein [Roseovarius gaetbuli]